MRLDDLKLLMVKQIDAPNLQRVRDWFIPNRSLERKFSNDRFGFMLAPSSYPNYSLVAIAYINYEKFEMLTERNVVYVTKLKKILTYEVLEDCMDMTEDGKMAYRVALQTNKAKFSSQIFLWRERKCNQDPNMGHINSKSSHDITPKAIESLLEFLRIGYNGMNRTHVLHQSQ